MGWWSTNPCLPNICGWEGGVPADFGVIRTELFGDMLGAKLEALMVGIGIYALCGAGMPCWGTPGWNGIMVFPLISSCIASWLAFCVLLHFALLF